MNSKIHELKIANYKKKLIHKYFFLNVNKLFYGNEDTHNSEFSKKIINSDKAKIKEFCIYDIQNNVYIDDANEYKKALEHFRGELKKFCNREDIIFNVLYNQERFRIQCPYREFALLFDEIDDFEETIIVYDESLTKLVAIFRTEYSFEVLSYCKLPQ